MKLKIIFTQPNPDFDRQYAKEYHLGKESDGNSKVNWSKALDLNVSDYSIKDQEQFILEATNELGHQIEIMLKDVVVLNCTTTDHEYLEIVVSKKLITRIFKNISIKNDLAKFYYYFKPGNNHVMVDRLMYVHKDDLPQGIW